MRYAPEPVPRLSDLALQAYLDRELSRLADTLRNPDPAWDDLRVALSTAKPGATNPPGFSKLKDDGAGSTGVFAYHFDASTDEEVFFDVQLPHGFKEYSALLKPHLHWCPTTTNTGNVRWGLEYTWANYTGTFGNSTIIYARQAGSGTAYQHQIAAWSGIVATGMTISSVMLCRLFRDANATGADADDYTADAAALSFDLHIELDSLGSEREYTKRL